MSVVSMSLIPVLQVSHLASSASFYAAVCQPLGVRCISQYPHSHSSQLSFGLPATSAGPGEILFTLTPALRPEISYLKFRATSAGAVTAFHWRALEGNYHSRVSTHTISHTPDESIARITDLDGNILEAKFISRSALVITTSSKEVRRVEDWQRNVAQSLVGGEGALVGPSMPLARSLSSRLESMELGPTLLRRETIATSHPVPREGEGGTESRLISGISNQALMGTILGAAAGAAVAYAMVKSEEPRPPTEPGRPIKMVTYHMDPAAISNRGPAVETIVEAVRSVVLEPSPFHAGSSSRVGDVVVLTQDPALEQQPVLEEIAEDRSVTHVSRRSNGGHRSHRSQGKAPSEVKDSSSRVSRSSRHTSRTSKDLPEAPEPPISSSGRSEKPYHGDDGRSKVSKTSKTSRASKSESRHDNSYHSARSETSTIKPEKTRSSAGSSLTEKNKEALDRASERHSTVTARNIPLPESTHVTRSSHKSHRDRDRDRDSGISGMSARDVPLPESVYDGPAYSVAPSDSISSVGLKRERHRRHGPRY
jgi:hypothetical protein